jgi:hypothetical protein
MPGQPDPSRARLWPQGIQEYNGGAVLGMAGKNCVAVACDMRYGAQMQTMAIDKNKVFKMHDRYVRQAPHARRGAAACALILARSLRGCA